MEYTLEVLRLSSQFNKDYPKDTYPELMHKQGRPYTCLLIDLHCDYFICIHSVHQSSIRTRLCLLEQNVQKEHIPVLIIQK